MSIQHKLIPLGLLALALVVAGCPQEGVLRSPDKHAGATDAKAIDAPGPLPDGSGVKPDAKPLCPNGRCDPGEHCQNCPADCGQCGPKTHSFAILADSYVDQNNPSQNYGSEAVLLTDQAPDQQALLRFAVAGVSGTIESVKLRLHVTNGSGNGPAVHLTSDPWQESTVTWDNRPKPTSAVIADLGNVTTGWVEIDVTSAVTKDGTYSFLLLPTGSDGMDVNSKESGQPPELVLVTAGGTPPPDGGTPQDSGPPPQDTGTPPNDSGSTGQGNFTFFVLGDTRSNPSIAQQNFKSMSQLDPKAVLLLNSGDITADGEDSQWQAHEQAVSLGSGGKIRMDLTTFDPAYIRYFGVIGNHDIHTSAWLNNWNKYLSGQQGLGHNGTDGIWYSVTYKNALFLALDSHHSYSTQTTWLKQQLAAAATNPAIKWRFVFFHRPVYPCNSKSPFSDGIPWVREFEKYGVDMVFLGHAHVYERTCAMVGGKCQGGGVVYITSGGGGAGTYGVDPGKTATAGTDSYDCNQVLQMGKGNWHHYCHAQVEPTKLTFRCYSDTSTSNPGDTLVLTK